jgi:voltage-gated potassium channel
MLVLSGLFLAVLVIPVLDTGLSPDWKTTLLVVDVTVWVLFSIEYLTRLVLASNRRHFVVHHVVDLLVIAVPVLLRGPRLLSHPLCDL